MKRSSTLVLLTLLAVALGASSCSGPQQAVGGGKAGEGAVTERDKAAEASGPLVFTAFIMSKCPFCGRALPAVEEAVARFDGAVKFRLEFVLSAEGGRLTTLHGEAELAGDLLLACAQERAVAPNHFMKLLRCMEESYRAIPDNFQECSQEQLSAEEEAAVLACAKGAEGVNLLVASARRSKEAEVRGAPTFFIGEAQYDGGRSVDDFVEALCDGMGRAHSVCGPH